MVGQKNLSFNDRSWWALSKPCYDRIVEGQQRDGSLSISGAIFKG